MMHIVDGVGHTGDDAGEQDHRGTVADAVFTDPVTQPHNQHRTGHKAADNDDCSKNTITAVYILDCRHLVLQRQIISEGHEDGKAKGNKRCDLVERLSAFLALALQPLQRRQRIGQKLDNDGGVDVRRDGQGEDCCLGQRTTRQDVEVFQEVSARCRTAHPGGYQLIIQERNSDGTAQPEDDNDE